MLIQAKPRLKSTILHLAAGLALCAVTAFTVKSRAQQLISFDAPGSSSGYLQGTAVWGINASGTITGDVTDSSGATHGYLRSAEGKFAEFDVPGANLGPGYGCEYGLGGTCPSAINDHGAVVGWDQDSGNVYHGFLRSPEGKIVMIDIPEAGTGPGQGTHPQSINNSGAVTGYYVDSNNLGHGFLRTGSGGIITFDCPEGGAGPYQGTYPGSINDSGVITGTETDSSNFGHGMVRWGDGSITVFDAPDSLSSAYGLFLAYINDEGVIAGSFFQGSANVAHGFQRSPDGKLTEYQVPSAGTGPFEGAWLYGLNAEGTTVGYVEDNNNESRSFIRDAEGKITVLAIPGQLFAPGSTYGSGAFAINERGVVAGRWYDTNWTIHGWILLPKDR